MNPLKAVVRLLRTPWHDRLNLLHSAYILFKTSLYYRHICAHVGRGCRIYKPFLLSNPRFVTVGERTMIRAGARIETIVLDEMHPPELIIGSNVNIEQNAHIICSSRIVIGDNVTITGNCAVVDTTHPFQDVNETVKIGERIDSSPTPVEIGEGTLIGFGAVILPNVRIGKHCVVGANCTVTRDVPDYCVVAGNPATIVLRYDLKQKIWI
jgi:acetyltransferase-like isoleucine patch superfamily enzyme